ncbi:type IV toxin-antitoxin system AbiEi family antitoxin domain-containing protein [Kitasatospora purpeofusca]|uniref:type IV toxin-antitoxin system AbiEi family antitoxin domain-containing protein n=1 Tax=Kitasatospora purpeofusca TaxID=67352 RepID=UPI00382F3376
MERVEQMVIVGGIAADQWGLVTAKQAAEQGVNGVRLKRLTDAGLLEHVSRGVYLVPGAGYPQHLEIKAAWLRLAPAKAAWQRESSDPDSGVVSHTSACLLHDLGDIPAGEVEITVPRRRVSRDPDVRLRTGVLEPADITLIDGLPVTTAERTVVDLLRSRADAGHIGGVIAAAEHRDLVVLDALADRVRPFAKSYGVSPAADGRVLIDHLVAQGGARLRADDARDLARAAYGQGAADIVLGRALESAELQRILAGLPRVALALSSDEAVAENLRSIAVLYSAQTTTHIKDAIERVLLPVTESLGESLRGLALPSAAAMQQMFSPFVGLDEAVRYSLQEALRAVSAVSVPRTAPALPQLAAPDEDTGTVPERPEKAPADEAEPPAAEPQPSVARAPLRGPR